MKNEFPSQILKAQMQLEQIEKDFMKRISLIRISFDRTVALDPKIEGMGIWEELFLLADREYNLTGDCVVSTEVAKAFLKRGGLSETIEALIKEEFGA